MHTSSPAPVPAEAPWDALLEAVGPLLRPALARLPLLPSVLPPVVTARPGEALSSARGIALPAELLGPGTHHPLDDAWARQHEDLAGLALDRWRRATGLVLEGLVLAGMQEEVGAALPRSWWTLGFAAERVDAAAPELGWLWPEAVDLLRGPEQGLAAHPRRAAWLFRWLRGQGLPPAPGERPELDAAAWSGFAHWVLDPAHGPASTCPLPLSRGPADPARCFVAPPLSFRRLHAAAGPAGLVLQWPGGGGSLAPGEAVEPLVTSLHGGPVEVTGQTALPLGPWRLAGGTVGERPGAARGIELDLHEDGSIDVVFADAFAGPPTPYLLGLAKTLGVSGTGRGRFRVQRVDGPGRGALVFEALEPDILTVHPRLGGRFALPAESFLGPIQKALAAMTGVSWEFLADEEGLRLEAGLFGAATVLRLVRPEGG